MSDKTPGQIAYEASEAAEWNVASDPWDSDWHQLSQSSQQEWEAIAQAVLAAHGPQWQPIETAPKDGTVVLLWVPEFMQQPYEVGWWDGIGWSSYFEIGCKPTHWQPLPAAPNETKE